MQKRFSENSQEDGSLVRAHNWVQDSFIVIKLYGSAHALLKARNFDWDNPEAIIAENLQLRKFTAS